MKENSCLVSVVVPAYNAEKTLRKTMDAIISQTYRNLELIVVDDGSRDRTCDVVKSYDDSRIHLFSKINGGVSSARNFGIKNSRGEYIAFCDADDVWDVSKLEKQMNILLNDQSIDFIGCNRNGEETKVFLHRYDKIKRIEFNDLILKTFPQTSTAIIKKTVFDEIGLYDETQKYAEDGNLWLRICYKKKCYMMPESLVITGDGKPSFGFSGLSANLKGMSDGVLKNIKEMYSLGYISFVKKNFLFIFEKLKYVRRILICKLRK